MTTIGRLGRPEEIASAALFLATPDSGYVVGTELFVTGGHVAVMGSFCMASACSSVSKTIRWRSERLGACRGRHRCFGMCSGR